MTISSFSSKVAVFVAIAAGVASGVAVGADRNDQSRTAPGHANHAHEHRQEALGYALAHLRDRYESGSLISIERTLADLLPNRRFAVDGAEPRAVSSGVVIGTVTAVDGGAGYAVTGADADNGTLVAFDAEDALWRVAELTVSVSDSFGINEPEVRIALPFDGRMDREAFLQGFAGQRVIVALAPQGAVQHDRTLYSIAHGGGAIGLVSDEGQLSLPVMGESQAAFMDGLTSVRELRRQARTAGKVFRVVVRGGIPHVQE
jgi:hypothetical protein